MAADKAQPIDFAKEGLIEVRRGFGIFDMANLEGNQLVAASGLRDGGWIVYERKAGVCDGS